MGNESRTIEHLGRDHPVKRGISMEDEVLLIVSARQWKPGPSVRNWNPLIRRFPSGYPSFRRIVAIGSKQIDVIFLTLQAI